MGLGLQADIYTRAYTYVTEEIFLNSYRTTERYYIMSMIKCICGSNRNLPSYYVMPAKYDNIMKKNHHRLLTLEGLTGSS